MATAPAKPMTKTQLVAALADEMGSDKKTATAALDAIQSLVARVVSEGGALTLPGIGKVACRARPERQVRNPQTQEMMTKPADKVVKVTIAKALKDSVNA
ncbi:HU family DNA-binding protein [Paracoccus luteus]|uniref:HU family DNA-binding protein n=1 Tax=Paracoccus luteus TaxID=2508543 RepID=UPI00106FFEC7|nr:HU family DNA-binding protein [Paracoccus luteus]